MPAPNAETPAPIWDAAALADPHRRDDKADRVRRMFDRIAPTYELVNSLSSAGQDRYWRRRAVRLSGAGATDEVLDIACGTGDLARAFARAGVSRVIGADFAMDMLRQASRRATAGVTWCLADAQRLPVAAGSFTIASCAFGVRNFQSLSAGLAEMHRVLRPGGRAVILEFSLPTRPLLRRAYRLYLEGILPRLAGLVSRDRSGAYRYLARSVVSFVDEQGMVDALRGVGFAEVARHPLTFGVVQVYVARKSA